MVITIALLTQKTVTDNWEPTFVHPVYKVLRPAPNTDLTLNTCSTVIITQGGENVGFPVHSWCLVSLGLNSVCNS